MSVLSFTWIAWMVSTVAFYWLLPSRFRTGFLVAVTLLFLLSVDWRSALILVSLTCITYLAAEHNLSHRIAIPAAIATVAAVLVFFKWRVSSGAADLVRDVAMPLGLSYYSFRLIHYLIERARGALPEHHFDDYLSYLLFLPTIVVGPIHRFRDFHNDLHTMSWRAADISGGLERVLFGYFKIAVLGDFILARLAAHWIAGFGPDMTALTVYLEAVRGSFLLYILFSGYSDIAIGFSRTLGFHVMENFRWPFLQKSIGDFWRTWHISLTSWSRDYVFTTVIGLSRNPILATLASLLVIGIWHELSPRYVAWGLYHAFGIIAVAQLQKWSRSRRGPRPLRVRGVVAAPRSTYRQISDGLKILATANYCFFGYVIISSHSVSEILQKYNLMLFSWWI
jgi:alginate O-acetyltransferase complex protein AlgI